MLTYYYPLKNILIFCNKNMWNLTYDVMCYILSVLFHFLSFSFFSWINSQWRCTALVVDVDVTGCLHKCCKWQWNYSTFDRFKFLNLGMQQRKHSKDQLCENPVWKVPVEQQSILRCFFLLSLVNLTFQLNNRAFWDVFSTYL